MKKLGPVIFCTSCGSVGAIPASACPACGAALHALQWTRAHRPGNWFSSWVLPLLLALFFGVPGALLGLLSLSMFLKAPVVGLLVGLLALLSAFMSVFFLGMSSWWPSRQLEFASEDGAIRGVMVTLFGAFSSAFWSSTRLAKIDLAAGAASASVTSRAAFAAGPDAVLAALPPDIAECFRPDCSAVAPEAAIVLFVAALGLAARRRVELTVELYSTWRVKRGGRPAPASTARITSIHVGARESGRDEPSIERALLALCASAGEEQAGTASYRSEPRRQEGVSLGRVFALVLGIDAESDGSDAEPEESDAKPDVEEWLEAHRRQEDTAASAASVEALKKELADLCAAHPEACAALAGVFERELPLLR